MPQRLGGDAGTIASMAQARVSRRAFIRYLASAGILAAALTVVHATSPSRLIWPFRIASAQADSDAFADVADALDYDVARIFRFVADEIRYEPYAGALRGPAETLTGRAGNSADQALLLAELLRAALIPIRFVTGSLDESTSSVLMKADEPDAETVLSDALRVLPSTEPQAPDDVPSGFQRILDHAVELNEAAAAAAESQSETGIRTVIDSLAAEGIQLPGDVSRLPTSELVQHVWLQALIGSEWQDLDPTLPGGQQGQAIATQTDGPFDRLADDLRHRVEFVVEVERISGDSLTREPVLQFSGYADELAGIPIALVHADPPGAEAMGISISGAFTGETQYVPMLAIGDQAFVGKPLSLEGGGGILGDLELGEGNDRNGEATAEWLLVRTMSPDGTVSLATRTLFDRVGAGARQSGSIDVEAIPAAPLVRSADNTSDDFLPLLTVRFLTVTTGATSFDTLRVAQAEDGPGPLQLGGLLYNMGRDALAASLAPDHGIRVFLDRPNVVSYEVDGLVGTNEESPTFGLDVLHRSFGTASIRGMQPRDAPGVVAGVISHVAERLAMGDGLHGEFAPLTDVISVGGVFERAAADGIPVRVVTTDSLQLDGAVTADERTRLRGALDDGWVGIVPASPVEIGGQARYGWWLVDPMTGRTLDEMDDGRGSVATEGAISNLGALWRGKKYVRFVLCLVWLALLLDWFVMSIVFPPYMIIGALPHLLLHYPMHKFAHC